MKVLVTGASGFVGGVTCAELVGRGHDVAALVRRPGSEPTGTRAVSGDLREAASLAADPDAETTDCVIPPAAEIASQRDGNKVRAVNVEGTRALLDACRASDSPRFVFAS